MVDPVADFRDALDRVPRLLLDAEDGRILIDAITSAEVLENLVSIPRSIVLVGCTGVGKSHLTNALVGTEVTAVGVLRPTTRSIVMAGSVGPVPIAHEYEYAVARDAPAGLVFVDTPAWELDPAAVGAALAAADVGILVVSPTRYGDAATGQLWHSMATASKRLVVLNRLSGSDAERSEMIAFVKDRFSVSDISVVHENGGSDSFVRTVVEGVPRVDLLDDKAAIARTSAVGAGRHIASVVTATATDLGRLGRIVDTLDPPSIRGHGLGVRESWLATEQEIMNQIHGSVDMLDRVIVEAAGGAIATRIADDLGQWNPSRTRRDLDVWRDAAAARFRRDATIRWRRSSTERLLDQNSWKAGVNPTVQISERVRRVMRSNLDEAIGDLHRQLVTVADAAVEGRRADWRSSIEQIGSFKPGELLAASDVLSRP